MSSEEFDCTQFLAEVAPFLVFPDEDKENNFDYVDRKSQDPDPREPSMIAGSSSMVPPVPILSSSETEEIRHAAADTSFLEDLGLTPQAFMALLDGTGIEWDEEEEEEEEEEDGEDQD